MSDTKEVARRDLDMDALFAKAIEHDRGIEVIERLVALRQQMKAELAKEAFFAALARFQASCPAIKKRKEVWVKGELRYKYAPLDDIVDQIKDTLFDNGFSYVLDAGEQTGSVVTAICDLHHVDGHHERTKFAVPIDEKAYMNAPQKAASALTYAKRYAFCNALGIMTADEDDDAVVSAPRGHDEEMQEQFEAMQRDAAKMVLDAKLDGLLTADEAKHATDKYSKLNMDGLQKWMRVFAEKIAERKEQEAVAEKEPVNDPKLGKEPDYSGAEEAFGDPEQAEIF